MALRKKDLGASPEPAQEPAANWEPFRGLATRENAAAHSRTIMRNAALWFLVVILATLVTVITVKLGRRIPSLYSSARAEVVALASRFHSEPPAQRVADPEPPARSLRRASRHAASRARFATASRDRMPRPFDAYLVENGREVLIGSMGQVVIVDMTTGNFSWVRN